MTVPPAVSTGRDSTPLFTHDAAAHSSGDAVLTALLRTGCPLSELVAAFPGTQGLPSAADWLDGWFLQESNYHYSGGELPAIESVNVADISRATADDRPRLRKVERIVSVRPQWFRGFRALADAIPLDSSLLLIDGRNSTGKTSIAEALEWLFRGELARRALGENGNARELEGCVGNHFRPIGEDTWVEGVFRLECGGMLALRRVLEEDYGPKQNSVCRSRLLLDGVELSAAAAAALLDDLFGGAPPLLMQHTLRLFVHSAPKDRRLYFERLLRVDELTALIERAVMGASRLPQIVRKGDHGSLGVWHAFKNGLATQADRTRLTRIEKRPRNEIADAIRSTLTTIAATALAVRGDNYASVRGQVEAAQSAARQRQLPLLGKLRPRRTVDDALKTTFSRSTLDDRLGALRAAVAVREAAQVSARDITEAQLAIAGAMAALTDANLLPAQPATAITCPVCEFGDTTTLSVDRIMTVRGWQPIRVALQKADAGLKDAAQKLRDHLQSLYRERKEVRPDQPDDEAWKAAVAGVDGGLTAAVSTFRSLTSADDCVLKDFDDDLISLGKNLPAAGIDASALREIEALAARCSSRFSKLLEAFGRYGVAVHALEQIVGSSAGGDAQYAARERWLTTGDRAEEIADDQSWEQSKAAAAALLENARTELKTVRQQLLEARRTGFNDGIGEVWSTLRGDTYSVFSHIHIPESHGKGFQVEIEVKARLDDGRTQEEVDALRVFSESQVNALGIAAFITRAKMLGHRVLIFDDPVQSMDEEHFQTFARGLLTHLLDAGFQVILLTHNDTFARAVSVEHHQREDFTSLKIRFSREGGSAVDLGHRRLRERLARVDRAMQKGDLDTACIELRKGTERLLTGIRAGRHDCGVKDYVWNDFTAKQMFNQGAGDIIRTKSPKFATRLDALIDQTSAGGHDAPAPGETDLRNGVSLVRTIARDFGLKD